MMTGLIQDQNLEKHIEKQIGCMSGFLHIFDRQQILSGKRIYSTTKHLPPPPSPSSPCSVKSVNSVKSVKPVKLVNEKDDVIEIVSSIESVSSDVLEISVAKNTPPKSWKFCKDMPRLSLDSRATVDSKGSLCKKEVGEGVRSPSVIARLMGLEQLPSDNCSSPESVEKPVLRRSASESRVSRDLFHSRFVDTNQSAQIYQTETNQSVFNRNVRNAQIRNQKNESGGKIPQWRSRSFFDSGDFFPEPKPTVKPVYDSGKKMKMRGINNDQSEDLEALKHILEALQLKGLLHSKKPLNRNIVYDPNFDSNTVSPKPWRSPVANRRFGNNLGSANNSPAVSPRSGRSPVRARVDSNLRNNNSIVKRKPLTVETQRSFNERNSPINSPKLNSVTNRSPIRRKPMENVYSSRKSNKIFLTEDEISSSSVSSGSSTSHSDRENRDGKSLLQRCDKLLQNIAEFNTLAESHHSVIPSPVSVLDSAFNLDDSSSPSPVMKRTIDFKDVPIDIEDEIWSSIISPARSTNTENEFISNDSDFTYISEILEASKYLSDESTVFSFLEKQQYYSSKGTKLHRKLIFDIINEIIDRNRELPPWSSIWVTDSGNSVKKICLEFQKIREPEKSENFSDPISPALKKDLNGNNSWGDFPIETSEAILYIERQIFKDLVSETIQDLAESSGKTTFLAPRRKLVF